MKRLDVVDSEPFAVDFGLAELRDEILAGLAQALLHEGLEVRVELTVRFDTGPSAA